MFKPLQSFGPAQTNGDHSNLHPHLNPMAGDFQPTSVSVSAPPRRDTLVNSMALVRAEERVQDLPSETEVLEAKVVSMRDAIVRELCILRHDVDTLKSGGWTIRVGPFQQVKEPGFKNVQAVHDRIIDASRSYPRTLENGADQEMHQAETVVPEQDQLLLQDIVPAPEVVKPLDADASTLNPFVPGLSDVANTNIAAPATTKPEYNNRSEEEDGENCNASVQQPNGTHHSSLDDVSPRKIPETEKGPGPTKIPCEPIAEKRPTASSTGAATSQLCSNKPNGTVTDNETSTATPQHVQPSSRNPATIPPVSVTDPDQPVPSIEDPARKVTEAPFPWQPLAVRRLTPLARETFAKIPTRTTMKTFGSDFLDATFGGIHWSCGLYYVPPSHGSCILPHRTYYVLESTYEPYLPRHPGAHGAKLTAFFNTNPTDVYGEDAEGAYLNVPVFIKSRNGPNYIYYGTYSQLRWSDKLDYDRMVEHVPNAVKMHWAGQLSEVGRPEWVTKALMNHFWPKPEYEGAMPSSSVDNGSAPNDEEADRTQVLKDVGTHVEDLKDWEKEARMKVGLLKKENILEAFEKEDAGDPPGLRLWWEYLECVDWDDKFYNMLVKLQSASPRKR